VNAAVTAPLGDVAELTARVREVTSAAARAYRDTARLIRLLTVLSSPSSPDELVGRALSVISEVFTADVVCVARVNRSHLYLTGAIGLPEDDPSLVDGWPADAAATEATVSRRAVACDLDRPGARIPASLAHLGLRSAAFVPMSAEPSQYDELLLLYRSSTEPFSGTDLHVLASVAQRLSVAA
jgi:K+-sensing histidine kinase KdpD